MKIALITEGTYPFHGGGVSVWCDQLIRGMPENRFHVIAVSGNGTEKCQWDLPRNVEKVTSLPIWAAASPERRMRQQAVTNFRQAHQNFVQALIRPDADHAVQMFMDALKVMFAYAQKANLSAALLSNESLAHLSEAWNTASKKTTRLRNAAITFADALTATDLIEHFLRPLSYTPPEADLFHAASNGLSSLIGLTGKWVYGVPFILTEHGVYLRERYLSYLRGPGTYPVKTIALSFFRLLSNAAYQGADLIKPGSQYNQRWELQGGAAPGRIRTVYNGIDVNEFPTLDQEPAVPTLSWLGRIDPIKDVHTLIRTFAAVHSELPDARLRMFGAAPPGNDAYLQSCKDLIASLGLENVARFEGKVAHPVQAYHAGHVVLLTSISEGFPYTLIEAMAAGKATVSTRVGGVAEGAGDAGLVVPPRDHQALAAACLVLLRDPERRRALGVAARERVIQHFTLEQCLAAYRSSYAEMRKTARPVVERQRATAQPSVRWRTA